MAEFPAVTEIILLIQIPRCGVHKRITFNKHIKYAQRFRVIHFPHERFSIIQVLTYLRNRDFSLVFHSLLVARSV
jgi:hypothetical protein